MSFLSEGGTHEAMITSERSSNEKKLQQYDTTPSVDDIVCQPPFEKLVRRCLEVRRTTFRDDAVVKVVTLKG